MFTAHVSVMTCVQINDALNKVLVDDIDDYEDWENEEENIPPNSINTNDKTSNTNRTEKNTNHDNNNHSNDSHPLNYSKMGSKSVFNSHINNQSVSFTLITRANSLQSLCKL